MSYSTIGIALTYNMYYFDQSQEVVKQGRAGHGFPHNKVQGNEDDQNCLQLVDNS